MYKNIYTTLGFSLLFWIQWKKFWWPETETGGCQLGLVFPTPPISVKADHYISKVRLSILTGIVFCLIVWLNKVIRGFDLVSCNTGIALAQPRTISCWTTKNLLIFPTPTPTPQSQCVCLLCECLWNVFSINLVWKADKIFMIIVNRKWLL